MVASNIPFINTKAHSFVAHNHMNSIWNTLNKNSQKMLQSRWYKPCRSRNHLLFCLTPPPQSFTIMSRPNGQRPLGHKISPPKLSSNKAHFPYSSYLGEIHAWNDGRVSLNFRIVSYSNLFARLNTLAYLATYIPSFFLNFLLHTINYEFSTII